MYVRYVCSDTGFVISDPNYLYGGGSGEFAGHIAISAPIHVISVQNDLSNSFFDIKEAK